MSDKFGGTPSRRRSLPGIFCLEGEWSEDLRSRKSVLPLLEALERMESATAIHRDVATREELIYYVERWRLARYSNYSIGYFAFHGSPGKLDIGKDSVTLDELGRSLEGRCSGRMIHFSACGTMHVADEELADFRDRTGAWAVSGYTKDVDWLRSAAFDFLLFAEANTLTRSHALRNRMEKLQGGLVEDLGWTIV